MQKRARDGRAREPSSTRELVESFGVLGESDGEDDATAPGAADGGGGGGVDAIVAVVENRRFEVGVACLRTSDFVVQMSQFCDDQAYSKALSVLAAHEPRQLLFLPGAKDEVLERICRNEFGLARFETVGRKY